MAGQKVADHKCKGIETCRSCKWYDANPSTIFPYSIFGVQNHAPLFYLSRIECHPPMRSGCKLTLLDKQQNSLEKSHSSQKKKPKTPAYYYHANANKHAILMNTLWANRKSVWNQ